MKKIKKSVQEKSMAKTGIFLRTVVKKLKDLLLWIFAGEQD